MADNVTVDNGTGTDYGVAGDKVTYSGDADQTVQLFRPVHVTGSEGSKTTTDLSNTNGLIVGVGTGPGIPTIHTDAIPQTDIYDALTYDSTEQGPLLVAGVVYNGTTWDRLRGNTSGVFVNGGVAHDATDAGNPIKIGGYASDNSPSAVTAGDRVNAWFDLSGRLQVGSTLIDESGAGGGLTILGAGADAVVNTNDPLWTGASAYFYNGTTWDRMRGDTTNGLDVDVTRLPALVASSANIGDVDVLTLPGITGAAAHASPTSGNPVFIAGRASAVIPTDVGADGDAAGMWTNRNGAQMVSTAPHIGLNSDPWNLVHEAAQYTSAQTSTVLVAGGASEKVVVTKVQIQSYGTTAGTCILYFGTGAYSRGTNRAIFDGEFAPSATLKPGVIMDGPFIAGTNGDDVLVTTTNAQSVTISIWFYVIT